MGVCMCVEIYVCVSGRHNIWVLDGGAYRGPKLIDLDGACHGNEKDKGRTRESDNLGRLGVRMEGGVLGT